jgi:hypothetical protein
MKNSEYQSNYEEVEMFEVKFRKQNRKSNNLRKIKPEEQQKLKTKKKAYLPD